MKPLALGFKLAAEIQSRCSVLLLHASVILLGLRGCCRPLLSSEQTLRAIAQHAIGLPLQMMMLSQSKHTHGMSSQVSASLQGMQWNVMHPTRCMHMYTQDMSSQVSAFLQCLR